MKRNHYKRIATALAVISIAILTGCGATNSTIQDAVPGVAPGAVVTPGGAIGGACLPLNAQIPFTITNGIVAMPNRKLLAGMLPNTAQAYGQVILGSAVAPIGTVPTGPLGSGVSGGTLQSAQNAEALITLSLSQTTMATGYNTGYNTGYTGPLGYTGVSSGYFGNGWGGLYFPAAQNPINATGTIQVNPYMQQYIATAIQTGQIPLTGAMNTMPYAQTGYYQNGYYQNGTVGTVAGTTACISGLALSIDISNNGLLYLGEAYLYLNNTQHGFILKF